MPKIEDQIYNFVLNHVESVMGNKVTDEDQLRRAGKQMFGEKFLNVYSADRRPRFHGKKKYAIMNLDPSWMPGSHWVAVIKDNNDLLVYDSLARKSTKILPILFKGGAGNVIDTEYDKEQDTKRDINGKIIREDNCGQRTLSSIAVYDMFGKDMFLKL